MAGILTTIMIDGGYVRHVARKAGLDPTPDFVEDLAHHVLESDERLHRVMYYDCRPYNGRQKKPISGEEVEYNLHAGWLDDIASRDYFAVRLGWLKFRGWQLRDANRNPESRLSDDDFQPVFEQCGADVRFGLDVANIIGQRRIDRIIVLSGDVDVVPTFKAMRLGGVQAVAVELPGWQLHDQILTHADEVRQINWPKAS